MMCLSLQTWLWEPPNHQQANLRHWNAVVVVANENEHSIGDD